MGSAGSGSAAPAGHLAGVHDQVDQLEDEAGSGLKTVGDTTIVTFADLAFAVTNLASAEKG